MKTSEILAFMHDNYEFSMEMSTCQYMITEFDSNLDRFIQYD